ncbi:MAG: hypothetical protein ACN6OP_06825 [Pseudomonadales bacterium]
MNKATASTTSALVKAASEGVKADYDAAVKQAGARYKIARKKCGNMKANAKDVCKAEAKRDRDVAKANAKATRAGTAKAQAKAHKVKADRDYDVAKEMCGDRKGNDKDVCVKKVKVAHKKALGAVRVEKAAATGTSKGISEARRETKKDALDD